MTKTIICNYTNCFYNNAKHGLTTGECQKDKVELRVWCDENDKEHHECKTYKFKDKGEAYRKGKIEIRNEGYYL